MKKILFYVLISISTIGYAQDQLFKKDNSKVEVKILEINQNEIKYKLFTYQDGPTITIAKKDVALIIYQNGVHEIINTTPETPIIETPVIVYGNSYNYRPSPRVNQDSIDKAIFQELVSTENLISFNIIEPMNGSFSVNYIREFAHNYLHVYVPVSVGFANPYFTQITNGIFTTNSNNNYYNSNTYTSVSNYKYSNKTYEVGLGIHFQTSGKRAVTHFVGPYVGMAEFKGTYDISTTTYDASVGYNVNTINSSLEFTMDRLYVMLNNGILFRVTKSFNIMMMAGLGYHIDTYKTNDPTGADNFNKTQLPINAFKFGLSFGYRF